MRILKSAKGIYLLCIVVCGTVSASPSAYSKKRKDLYNLYSHYLKGYILHKYSIVADEKDSLENLRLALKEYNLALGEFKESSRIHLNMLITFINLRKLDKAEKHL